MDADSSDDLLIMGGGAAGLAAAITAGRLGVRVRVLEFTAELGRKIKLSGGGRCNLSNAVLQNREIDFGRYYGAAKNFVKPTLLEIGDAVFANFFRSLKIELMTANDGKIFPADNSANRVAAALSKSAQSVAKVELNCALADLHYDVNEKLWCGLLIDGRKFFAKKILIAVGSPAFLRDCSGAENITKILRKCGHSFVPFLPALAPVLTNDFTGLSGISVVDAEITLLTRLAKLKRSERGAILFTHTGLSGPAILNVSATIAEIMALQKFAPVALNFIPELTAEKLTANLISAHSLKNLLAVLPARLREKLWLHAAIPPNTNPAQFTAAQRHSLFLSLTDYRLTLDRETELAQAMVARGGVKRDEVAAKNLRSKIAPELYFAGEIIDVDGVSGGFNLHWAFASGIFAARQALKR